MADELSDEMAKLEEAGLRRRLRITERLGGRRVRVDGSEAVDFASNDYLGLASDSRISAAAGAELAKSAFGGSSARLIAGNHPLHVQLERELARFKHAESALLFSSGYLANTGCIPALAGKDDVILADELNHASLVDGCRLSRAEVKVFRHCDLEQLDVLLAESSAARRRLIVVDGVFSMDGDIFPLDELVKVAKHHDAWTYVDDAHGTGVIGENGRGCAELFGVEGEIDLLMGTLGKALGTSGAFVCGSRTLTEFLTNRARSFIFTTATPPSLSAAALEALRIAETEPGLRQKLRNNCDHFRDTMLIGPLADRLKVNVRKEPAERLGAAGHIVPVIIGDATLTMAVGTELLSRGHLVGAVRPPTVPAGASRLRITLGAAHTTDDIDTLLRDLAEVLRTRA
jgi:8-amino-7-oxononanoate synthase